MITVTFPAGERPIEIPGAALVSCDATEVRIFDRECRLLATLPPDVALRYSEDQPEPAVPEEPQT